MDDEHRSGDSEHSAQQREERALEEKLKQDVAVGGPQCLAQPDLAGTLGHRDQHDVDDPDCAQCQCDQTYTTQEPIHRSEDFAHGFLVLYRVPFLPGVLISRVEAAMVAGDNDVEFIFGSFIFIERARLIVDERNRIPFFRIVAFEREEFAHGVKGYEDANVGGVLFLVPNHGQYADHLEAHSVEQDGVADSGTPWEQIARHFAAQDAYAAALIVILVIDPASDL